MPAGEHPSEGISGFEAGRRAGRIPEDENPGKLIPLNPPARPAIPEPPTPTVVTDSPGTRGRTSEHKGTGDHGQ